MVFNQLFGHKKSKTHQVILPFGLKERIKEIRATLQDSGAREVRYLHVMIPLMAVLKRLLSLFACLNRDDSRFLSNFVTRKIDQVKDNRLHMLRRHPNGAEIPGDNFKNRDLIQRKCVLHGAKNAIHNILQKGLRMIGMRKNVVRRTAKMLNHADEFSHVTKRLIKSMIDTAQHLGS